MIGDESRRRMYAGGRPNRTARFLNDLSAKMFSLGLSPHWAVTLETVNPTSATALILPLVIANFDHREFLVSMLGQRSRWVRNVRAAGGHAIVHAGRRRPVLLTEVAAEDRAPILKAYLDQAPGARAHVPVDRREPVAQFERIAADYPVFEIRYLR
ncbi:nitroreductase family deazaflavin-dependent oxidoreductase [Lacisediminihabitans sp. H27-G8]|uniref:nitroreductase family deazaflavin-dependent oxidoreductase n=1 Tax=Lacisediminihabitans sp. H27-G8 TaxID=3111909 RepID=UPI0038FC9E1D